VAYLGKLQTRGDIASFDAVFLDAHGGDLNGFFLLKGESAKLDAVIASTEWLTHITRAALHLDGAGVVRGVHGDNLMARMGLWTDLIPS
jgi:hypothetical protein